MFALMFLLAQIPPPRDYIPAPKPELFPTWFEVAAQKKPTAVFVGIPARKVSGMIVCQQPTFPGVKSGVIVALLYTDGYMRQHATLATDATDVVIRRAAGLEVSLPVAASFRGSSDCPT